MSASRSPTVSTVASGWSALDLPGRATMFVRGRGDGYDCLPAVPRIARDAAGRPRVALTLVLSRMPVPGDASIAPLVASGSLSLVLAFDAADDDLRASAAELATPCRAAFIRGGRLVLRDGQTNWAGCDVFGTAACCVLGGCLPPQPALDVLYALDGVPSGLVVATEFPGGPDIADVRLASLLGGVLDGLDRSRYLSLLVVNADGTAAEVPPLQRSLPGGAAAMRDAPAAVPMLAINKRLASLPFAMTASHAVQPSAAALIAGGATSDAIAVGDHAHAYLGNDMFVLPIQEPSPTDEPLPTEHYPMVSNPTAATWPDALDPSIAWYAPAFAPVKPVASGDPATAPFSFVLARTGTVQGPGGTLQAGLTATIRLTVKAVMPPETTAAFAANPALKPRAVALQNLSCAIEIPYRQSGVAASQTQRFPGTMSQSADQIIITVALLDDWVRLAYAALAFPAADQPPRVIVAYAFTSYQYVFAPRWGRDVVGDGLWHGLSRVTDAADLPSQLGEPMLVRRELKIVGPGMSVQYERERPAIGGRAPPSVLLGKIEQPQVAFHPQFQPIGIRRKILVTRSLVREEAAGAGFPCSGYGNFYLQRNDAGVATPIGCQDSLKLGETALHAFEEMPALRDPRFRVYRSLQQPGRFMVAPAAYRVGRFGVGSGGKAFRPMIMLYGVLDADPANNRYALTTTLIPDVPPGALARLAEQLAAATPSDAAPAIVYPTDPFVAAAVSYAWALPGGIAAPQALNVVDAINVTFSLPLSDAALLSAVIDRSGIQGGITFTLPDGSAINAALTVDTEVIGPPESGPVTAMLQGTTATLRNNTQQAMNVADLVTVTAGGATRVVAVNAMLAPGASATAVVNGDVATAFADARAAVPASIEELDVFVEDITTTVTFINQVNFANHQLTALGVQARMAGSTHVETAALPEGATADVSFTMPINAYLAHQTAQFAVVETRASGSATTAWRDWDLNKGGVIGITADLL